MPLSGLPAAASSVALVVLVGALLVIAKQFRSKTFAAFGVVHFTVATEDQLGLHHIFGPRAASLIRSATSHTGWISAHAEAVGQLVFLTLLAAVGVAFVWAWERPKELIAIRARLVLTGLLFALYLFAGGVDFLGAMLPGKLWPIIEESGERLVMTVSLAYVSGLVSVWFRRILKEDG
ncbi:MAG TPA: hypothetical protein VFD97_02650 [Acidimicrobiia bacterium]|nr:hypothetical protein [Acidimicrobiia bacterium]